jgi:hypothetical protein
VLGFKVVSMHVMSMYTSLLLYCLVVYTLHTWKIFVVFSCQLFIYFCTTFFFLVSLLLVYFPTYLVAGVRQKFIMMHLLYFEHLWGFVQYFYCVDVHN